MAIATQLLRTTRILIPATILAIGVAGYLESVEKRILVPLHDAILNAVGSPKVSVDPTKYNYVVIAQQIRRPVLAINRGDISNVAPSTINRLIRYVRFFESEKKTRTFAG